jgi:hypothetical protein
VTIAIRPSHEHETVAILPVICGWDQRRDLRHFGTTGKSVAATEFVSSDEQMLNFRHCEERKATKQSRIFPLRHWIASLSLAMTTETVWTSFRHAGVTRDLRFGIVANFGQRMIVAHLGMTRFVSLRPNRFHFSTQFCPPTHFSLRKQPSVGRGSCSRLVVASGHLRVRPI